MNLLMYLIRCFLTRFIDKYYENRRENTIVIGYSCPKSESGCFCMSLGIDPVYSSLSELFMFEDEENFYFKLNDSKASKIVQGLEDADYKLIKNGHNQNFTIDIKFPLDQDKMFNAAFWDEIFRKCIGCGTCTYLCPTCHCFEFCEQKGEDGIERIRCWILSIFIVYRACIGT